MNLTEPFPIHIGLYYGGGGIVYDVDPARQSFCPSPLINADLLHMEVIAMRRLESFSLACCSVCSVLLVGASLLVAQDSDFSAYNGPAGGVLGKAILSQGSHVGHAHGLIGPGLGEGRS